MRKSWIILEEDNIDRGPADGNERRLGISLNVLRLLVSLATSPSLKQQARLVIARRDGIHHYRLQDRSSTSELIGLICVQLTNSTLIIV